MADTEIVPNWKRSKEYRELKHWKSFVRKLSEVKNPDQALQEEKERLDAERGDIKSAARRRPIPDPDLLETLLQDLDKMYECGRKRGVLEPRDADMAREWDEDWKRNFQTLQREFVQNASRDRYFPFRTLSPSPAPASTAAERGVTRPNPRGSSGGAGNNAPKQTRNSGPNQGRSKRPRLANNISEAARDHREESDPRHDPDTHMAPDAEHEQHGGAPAPCRNSQPLIRFDDVYQGGHAEFKYRIGSYGDKFYIFRCDKHKKHIVSPNAVRGATTHLSSHRYSRSVGVNQEHAVDLIGIEVLDCDGRKQAMHNAALDRAPNAGPCPGVVTRRFYCS